MTLCTSSQDGTRLTKRKGIVLHPWLQVIKLLASLTYPLKKSKGQPTLYPIMSQALDFLNSRHRIGLIGVLLRCGCHLKL
jgi:hypothetical protein